jgi:hypothetical protein
MFLVGEDVTESLILLLQFLIASRRACQSLILAWHTHSSFSFLSRCSLSSHTLSVFYSLNSLASIY